MMTTTNETIKTDVPKLPANAMRNFVIGVPLVLLVAAGYLYAFTLLDVTPQWGAVGVGALGWVLALGLRGPVAALTRNLPQAKATIWMVSASGPAEELIRLAVLFLLGRTFPTALSIGFGWGAVEILFGIVNGLVALTILQKDDEKSREARELLARQGTLQNFGLNPLWGMWERIFATGIHVGFTLVLAAFPWAVVALIPLHSLVNLSSIWFRGKLWVTELVVTVAGTVAMVLGLLAHGKLF